MTSSQPDDAFYCLPSEEQIAAQQALALDALAAWDLGPVEAVELVAERENAVFGVDTATGRYAVRVHRAGYHADAALRSQIAWMRAIAESGVVATAEVIDTVAGEPFVVASHPSVPEARQVSVLAWVPGQQLARRLDGSDSADAVAIYTQLGDVIARLHGQGAAWERPAGFEALCWDAEGLVGDDAVWGRFWALDPAPGGASDGLDARARAGLERFRSVAIERLEQMGTGTEVFGLVHNDFLAENLLVDGGRLTLLDFDDCGEGWYLFDLAPALVSVATRGDYAEIAEAFFDAYGARRPLPSGWRDDVTFFFALRMATYAAWFDTRSHTRFAQELGPVVVAAAADVVGQFLDGTLEV